MKQITDSISLRLASLPDEESFWRECFYDSIRSHFAVLNLPEEELNRLLEFQFQSQSLDYGTNYPAANREIILYKGRPAGRLITSTEHGDFHIVELVVLTQYRNLGIGSAVISHCFGISRNTGLPIRFYVEKLNRAAQLYERLGFRVVAELETHFQMEWRPDGAEPEAGEDQPR